MRARSFLILVGACCWLGQSQVSACLWDSDTIEMEKARFPETAELISGQFPRHSQAFYEWRKAKCEAAIAKGDRESRVYDDLAVSQHKLGNHQGAIQTMLAKEKITPGLYKTYSNLGTFHIYTGNLDEAERWIREALAINPDAHFGREQYQLWLVQWVKAGKPRADKPGEAMMAGGFAGFAWFIQSKSPAGAERKKALKGILGMMRFADHDNPLLLEALGDVLVAGAPGDNAANLAAQAYLQASRRAANDAEKQRLQNLAEASSSLMTKKGHSSYGKALDAAIAQGQATAAQVARDEAAWIAAGKDAALEFGKKYLTILQRLE